MAAAPAAKVGPFLRLAATPADLPTARRLVEKAWPLAEIEARYRRVIDTYAGTLGALERGAAEAGAGELERLRSLLNPPA